MISTFVIGVTGGIGSGKSTVCELFAERFGVPVIDADVLAREVVEPGEPGLAALVERFGDDILTTTGTLDRPKLKRLVFSDDARRRELEQILHPRIRDRMRAALEAITAPYCLLGIPLLTEGGRSDVIDHVLVVDCPEEVQIERVRRRDDLTAAEVMAIMRTQASRESRRALADDIVINAGNRADLVDRIDELHQKFTRIAHERSNRRMGDEH